MNPITPSDFDSYLTEYVGNASKIAILLDYDGTLTPIVKHPSLAILSKETKDILERLASRPDVFIAIISGRGVEGK